MTAHDELLTFLTTTLGPSGVLCDDVDIARYRIDWAGAQGGIPLAVARPATPEQVAEILGYCHRNDIPVVPQGGGSGLVEAALPDRDTPELVISLERLNGIRHVDPINFSMSVDAGCILQTIKDAAEAEDCFFPLTLGAQGSCQIGGNIATNAGGLNVLRYGMMRQLVLGVEVALPDGRLLCDMKALHKNNTGYDLKQLFIGAEGTLGIVTGAVIKLFPRPQVTRTALIGCPDVESVLKLYAQSRRSCCDLLSAFELIPRICLELAIEVAPDLPDPLDEGHPVYILMEVAASGPVNLDGMIEALFEIGIENGWINDGVLATSDHQAKQLWRIREAMLEGQQRRGEHLRTDVSLPLSALSEFHHRAQLSMEETSPECTVIAYGHVGDGNLHFNVLPPPTLEQEAKRSLLHELELQLFDIVAEFSGSISAEHGIGRAKQAPFLETLTAPEHEIMRGIKRQIDPRGMMSPGRILPATHD
ncbi:FAD-binding oxidoreductase [Cobetia crustatorum]|uniref:FAD-binding oxidoreductase n=1 Tax=Cobetia crustatorum TaxID=553385 RepID=A0A558HMA4_9GAMM|nr:FAD-binding oxidoreductase [Cobetia crustatorum]TVU70181.1 FAD-binding oxidoreductase [Cobetia crustatorum]